LIANIASCDARDVDFAVAKAREAFDDGRWSALHPTERKGTLIRFAKLLTHNRRELAVLESIESGKTIYDCENVDIPETINTIKWHAELIDKIYDRVSSPSENHLAMIVRKPIGVVGLILPWNFPLLMLAWKIGPALASGCSIVVKPAEQTSLSILRVAALATEAGLPRGMLNVVTGSGAEAGEPIGRHMDIDMVSFAGSTVTGKKFLGYSAESNAKEVVLEMGGKNPAIVMDDADNLDYIAAQVVNGAFWNMGENCSASSWLIVHKSVKDELLKHIESHMRQWNTGNPLDPENRFGPLVSKEHYDRVSGYLDKIDSVLYGGGTSHNAFVEATVVEIPSNDHILAQEEIFGPVLSVIEITSLDQAVQIANDTHFGLCASLFTSNARNALRAARKIKAGTVTVNSFGEGDITTPFGGFKQSGFGGRDNSILAHDQYTQVKTIWLDLTDSQDQSID